jgi:hypothetical protein
MERTVFACCIHGIQLEAEILAYIRVRLTTSFVIQSSIVLHMNNVYVLSKLFPHHNQLVRKLFVIRTPLKYYIEQ